MIKLTGINKIYRTNEIETVALENVNLEVNKGEFLSIRGPSGCGKSTLLNIMGLLDAPTSGTIEIAGTKVAGMKDKELAAFRNRKLGFVFQSFHLINSLNVLDNVELPLLYRKVSAKERRHLAEEVLKKVGLSHRMRHMPTQLSGGQCQRVAIARAIIGNPEIILADEPTANLDSETGRLLICGRGFPVGPDEHPSAGQSLKFLMPDRAEAHRFQTLHFKAVVHDIAQAGHPAAPGERPLGLRYGIDHAEAEPRPAVYLYMYFSLCHNTNPARRRGLSVIYRVSSLPVSVLSTPSAGRASCRCC